MRVRKVPLFWRFQLAGWLAFTFFSLAFHHLFTLRKKRFLRMWLPSPFSTSAPGCVFVGSSLFQHQTDAGKHKPRIALGEGTGGSQGNRILSSYFQMDLSLQSVMEAFSQLERDSIPHCSMMGNIGAWSAQVAQGLSGRGEGHDLLHS